MPEEAERDAVEDTGLTPIERVRLELHLSNEYLRAPELDGDDVEELLKAYDALLAAQEWQDISTAPNDSNFRWYGLHVRHSSGHSWFEAHYVSHDDDGEMRLPSGDNFGDWAFSDFEVWCDAPPPPKGALIADHHHTEEK